MKITPLKAIRQKCLDCSGFSTREVRQCPCNKVDLRIEKCVLFPYRFGKRPKEKAEFTPIRAIRKYCLWCCYGSRKIVKDCSTVDCPLYKFRLGTNPNYKKGDKTNAQDSHFPEKK